MYKIIPQLLRRFQLKLVDPEQEWETQNYWFNRPAKVHVKVESRELKDML
jgi:hypothetical protein